MNACKFAAFAAASVFTFSLSAAWPVLKSYEGESLRRIKMPIGGIGTGTVSLNGRGGLVDWEIRNSPAKGFTPMAARSDASTAFWIRTETADGKIAARLLEGPIDTEFYEGGEGATPPNHGFPRFSRAEFKVAYPLAQVSLADPSMPVKATLEAMNPLVRGDSAESAIPAALLRWRIANRTDAPLKVSVYGFLVNIAGGTMEARSIASDCVRGISIGSADDSACDTTLGRTALVVPEDPAVKVSCATKLGDLGWMVRMDRIWKEFMASGEARDFSDPESHEDLPAAAVSAGVVIPAKGEAVVPFALGWRFPHRYGWTYNGYRSEAVCGPFPKENDLGNFYALRFASAEQAAAHLLSNLEKLESRTVDFVRGVCAAKAPDVVKEAALFNLSTLRCETCFRTADGHFFGWEGIFEDRGSCFGNCTHVWGYEHALIDLWPDLAKDMTDLQFGVQSDPATGHMSFRVGLPLAKHARATHEAADGQMQCVIKAYENWKKSGDDEWMRALYPRVRKSIEFCWREGGWDADCDGVMEGRQHNTMDVDYYGPNPQMEFLYLAALKAVAAMAEFCGDADFAAKCRGLVERGSKWTEANLFNGEWYEHKVAKRLDGVEPDYQLAAGCLVDQLVGDYASRHVGLGPVADEANSKKTIETILAKNSSSNVGPRYNCGRDYAFPEEEALKMAWYPEGRMPKKPFPYYGENMTGFEYVVAANLAQRGAFAAAEKVVRDIRSRYDGKKRNPFDEAECGHHYARALAAWSVLRAFDAYFLER